jgi:hypothetical protein
MHPRALSKTLHEMPQTLETWTGDELWLLLSLGLNDDDDSKDEEAPNSVQAQGEEQRGLGVENAAFPQNSAQQQQ